LSAYQTLEVTLRNGVAIVALNRPKVHNAFNEELIAEFSSAISALGVCANAPLSERRAPVFRM